jgi:hypothetical protein
MEKLCYVTAFLDIGRDDWKNRHKRTFTDYFSFFTPFVDMFKNISPEISSLYDLVIFIDEKHHDKVKNYIGNHNNIIIIPINEKFMINNISAWSRLEREKEIMSMIDYKKLIIERINCPEHHDPKYTIINHSKIDFVNFATILSDAQYFSWVDFGYCSNEERTPKYPLDITLLDKNKINYTLIWNLGPEDNDVIYTLLLAPERVGGFFFFGSREKIQEYQKLYHKIHIWFQEKNLADDDQHFVIQCNLSNPNLFRFECFYGWHKALVKYQKLPLILTEIMKKYGNERSSGHHNYTNYYSKIFDSIREKNMNILEVGIGSINPSIPSNMSGSKNYVPGSSLKAWREYFPNSNIYGCDIDRDILVNSERINTFFLDQTNPQSVNEQIIENDRIYDIIIDDGLHHFPTNWDLLKQIFIRLHPEGYYIIENIIDFNPEMCFKDPFFEQIELCYFKIPNPLNNLDNNIIVARKKGNVITEV